MFEKSANPTNQGLARCTELTQVEGGEGGVAELATDFQHVLVGAAHEDDGLEVHELLSRDVVDRVDEENFFLQDLGPRVDHRNDD